MTVYFLQFTVSDIPQRLLAACRSKTPDIYEIRGYLEHKECDVNIRDDEVKDECLYGVLHLLNTMISTV